jgi:hypothetical protein
MARCSFCSTPTQWGVIYFYPTERYKKWEDKNFHSAVICCEEEIPLFKAGIVESMINNEYRVSFMPSQITDNKRIVEIYDMIQKGSRAWK